MFSWRRANPDLHVAWKNWPTVGSSTNVNGSILKLILILSGYETLKMKPLIIEMRLCQIRSFRGLSGLWFKYHAKQIWQKVDSNTPGVFFYWGFFSWNDPRGRVRCFGEKHLPNGMFYASGYLVPAGENITANTSVPAYSPLCCCGINFPLNNRNVGNWCRC